MSRPQALDQAGEEFNVYASIIAEGDEGVGRILALLKEVGVDERTLVVFSTDNGPEHSTNEKYIANCSKQKRPVKSKKEILQG